MSKLVDCPDCGGDGYGEMWAEGQEGVVQWPCQRCHATGKVNDLELEDSEADDTLFERGHTINLPLVKDIAEIIYKKENRAFYSKDLGKL